MELYNKDCLEKMRDLSTNSIDLLFCDLPYGETSCKWDCKIDLEKFWKEINRICKINCPMFFTASTRFGVELINSNPKNFRYDLVWIKSCAVGFLNAKKMPMRKHELIYIFYRKLPLYDLSSHKHKFITEETKQTGNNSLINTVIHGDLYRADHNRNVPLYVSNLTYDPPLPNSVIKEEKNECYGEGSHNSEYIGEARKANVYEPPLPNSVIQIRGKTKELNNDVYNVDERMINGKLYHYPRQLQKGDESIYDPPLPNSVIKTNLYANNEEERLLYRNEAGLYEPPLPNSILEIKSEKGKHATQKPTALIEWILKYYSKEGSLILDPTMGSGTTGVACKLMNRKFIGIEKDETIYKKAVERINNIKII